MQNNLENNQDSSNVILGFLTKRGRLIIDIIVLILILFSSYYTINLKNQLHDANVKVENLEYELLLEKEKSTEIIAELQQVDIEDYIDEWTLSLFDLLVTREVNSDAYYIRNQYLYHNSQISRDKANYMALWTYAHSKFQSVDPLLTSAVQLKESDMHHFNPKNDGELIVSHAGAIGIMQIMPRTARIYDGDPRILEENIRIGVSLLAETSKWYKDDVVAMLAHYNGGSNPYEKIKMYEETKNYVEEVPRIYEAMVEAYRNAQ